jgi:hypothetical protein
VLVLVLESAAFAPRIEDEDDDDDEDDAKRGSVEPQ